MGSMDPDLSAAARALSTFDPLSALKLVTLRNDPHALALRGTAMAQLGELESARRLLRRAVRTLGSDRPALARALAAEAEVALAQRDLKEAESGFEAAADELEKGGDRENALFVRVQLARHRALVGKVREAAKDLEGLDLRGASARVVAMAMLAASEVAAKRTESRAARRHLRQAHAAARLARIPFLVAEVERAMKELEAPIARRKTDGGERAMTLEEMEALWRSGELVVDVRRREIRAGSNVVTLVTRPVLFALAEALAEAAPGAASRDVLLHRGFGVRRSSDSFRARLRVEIGRLRAQIQKFAHVRATSDGFLLLSRRKTAVHLVLPIHEGEEGALLAVLSDGATWSTSAIAKAVGKSQRSVQRALGALLEKGSVETVGAGRTRRWAFRRTVPFATSLLLASREPRG